MQRWAAAWTWVWMAPLAITPLSVRVMVMLQGLVVCVASARSDAFLEQLGYVESHVVSPGRAPPQQIAIIAIDQGSVTETGAA